MRISDWSSDVCSSELPKSDARQLLDSVADNLLAKSPEGATSLGIDTGARAAMRGQLGDRSAAGVTALADTLQADVPRVRAFDKAGLDHQTRTSLPVVESAYDVALAGFPLPYCPVTAHTQAVAERQRVS